ncbi:MAG: tetratricopeptide repeat protein [Rhodospirillaceae bacterium]
MKFALVLTSSLLASLSFVSVAKADSYSGLLDKSARAIVAEKWRAGLAATRELLDTPNLTAAQRAEGLTHLCIHLTQIGRSEHALRACNESIALNGGDWGAYVNRGNAHSALGNRIAAKADYRKAKELNPTAETVEIAESMLSETPYIFARPPAGAGTQQALGEQRLAE